MSNIPTHNSHGFSIEWNPETDSVEWNGKSYVVNDNYRFLAWYSGWLQAKRGYVLLVHRYEYPEHKKLEWEGYCDGQADPYMEINVY